MLLNGYIGDKTGQRILTSLGGLATATLGVILIVALPLENNVGRLVGYYLTQAFPTSFVALLSLISSNVAGYTKKTTVAALYLIGYCVGNIVGLFNHCRVKLLTSRLSQLLRLLYDYRPTYFSSGGCPSLRLCRNCHHCVLGSMLVHSSVHLVLVSKRESTQRKHPIGARLCET